MNTIGLNWERGKLYLLIQHLSLQEYFPIFWDEIKGERLSTIKITASVCQERMNKHIQVLKRSSQRCNPYHTQFTPMKCTYPCTGLQSSVRVVQLSPSEFGIFYCIHFQIYMNHAHRPILSFIEQKNKPVVASQELKVPAQRSLASCHLPVYCSRWSQVSSPGPHRWAGASACLSC